MRSRAEKAGGGTDSALESRPRAARGRPLVDGPSHAGSRAVGRRATAGRRGGGRRRRPARDGRGHRVRRTDRGPHRRSPARDCGRRGRPHRCERRRSRWRRERRDRALNLADRDERVRLSPDLLSRLDRDQLQRLRVARVRMSWEDRRTTPHPAELTLIANGAGSVRERRAPSPFDPSRGALESPSPSARGASFGVTPMNAEVADAFSKSGGESHGSIEGSPGLGRCSTGASAAITAPRLAWVPRDPPWSRGPCRSRRPSAPSRRTTSTRSKRWRPRCVRSSTRAPPGGSPATARVGAGAEARPRPGRSTAARRPRRSGWGRGASSTTGPAIRVSSHAFAASTPRSTRFGRTHFRGALLDLRAGDGHPRLHHLRGRPCPCLVAPGASERRRRVRPKLRGRHPPRGFLPPIPPSWA